MSSSPLRDTNSASRASEETTEEQREGGWFGGIAASFCRIKDKIPPQTKQAFDGIAGAIQRSATAIAAEFAQMEMDAEWEARRWMNEHGFSSNEEEEEDGRRHVPLPWEVQVEQQQHGNQEDSSPPLYVEDEALKMKILALSREDDTFRGPFVDKRQEQEKDEVESTDFNLDSHICVIHRLLEADVNLAKAHSKFSGKKLKENNFWRNYFHHCYKIKSEHKNQIHEDRNENQDDDNQKIHPTSEKGVIEEIKDEDVEIVEAPLMESTASSSEKKAAALHSPRTLSMEDFVLVGSEKEDLENLAADITKERLESSS